MAKSNMCFIRLLSGETVARLEAEDVAGSVDAGSAHEAFELFRELFRAPKRRGSFGASRACGGCQL